MQRWTDSLNDLLVPHIFKGINKIYNDIKRAAAARGGNSGFIKPFQLTLMEIKYLPEALLEEDYNQLLHYLKNNDMSEKLLTSLLTKIYFIIAQSEIGPNEKVMIGIPKNRVFVHKVYINAANIFFKEPLLFYHKYEPSVIQKNYLIILEKIKGAINKTINNDINNYIAVGHESNVHVITKIDRLNDIKKSFKTPRNFLDDEDEGEDEGEGEDEDTNVNAVQSESENEDKDKDKDKGEEDDEENEEEIRTNMTFKNVIMNSGDDNCDIEESDFTNNEMPMQAWTKENAEEQEQEQEQLISDTITYDETQEHEQEPTETQTNYTIKESNYSKKRDDGIELTQNNLDSLENTNYARSIRDSRSIRDLRSIVNGSDQHKSIKHINNIIDNCAYDLESTISIKQNNIRYSVAKKPKQSSLSILQEINKTCDLDVISLYEHDDSTMITNPMMIEEPMRLAEPTMIEEPTQIVKENDQEEFLQIAEEISNHKGRSQSVDQSNDQPLPSMTPPSSPIAAQSSSIAAQSSPIAAQSASIAAQSSSIVAQDIINAKPKITKVNIKLDKMRPAERNKTIRSILGTKPIISDSDSTLESIITSYSHKEKSQS